MSQSNKDKQECRFCAILESNLWGNREYFRCQAGRFDDKYGRRSFVWAGIWRPNKKVKTAQRDCPSFKVHPRVKLISWRGRP